MDIHLSGDADQPRVDLLIEFFGNLDYKLNKSQLTFCLYNLGYVNNCNNDVLDEESKKIVESIYASLEKEEKVLLNDLINVIKTIEGLKQSGLNIQKLSMNERKEEKIQTKNELIPQSTNQQQDINNFQSPPLNKEANHQRSDFTFCVPFYKQEENNMVFDSKKENLIKRFDACINQENVFQVNKKDPVPFLKPVKKRKKLFFTATVDIKGTKIPLKVYHGDNIFKTVSEFGKKHQISNRKQEKLIELLKKRYEKVMQDRNERSGLKLR